MYQVINHKGILGVFETRKNALTLAISKGYNESIPAKLNNVYIMKVRENYVRTPMRCKHTRPTWDMKNNARTGRTLHAATCFGE